MVADRFNISLYDMHIEIKGAPFVESFPKKAYENKSALQIYE